MIQSLHKPTLCSLMLLSAVLICSPVLADDPHWNAAEPATSNENEATNASQQTSGAVQISGQIGGFKSFQKTVGGAVKQLKIAKQNVKDVKQVAKESESKAKQQAAEQMVNAMGGAISTSQAKELMGNCSNQKQCTNAAQTALTKYSEDSAAFQLMSTTGMSPTMAKGLVKGCASSGGNYCSQVAQLQGTKYLTTMTTQTMSQYSQYATEANMKMATSCVSSDDASKCQAGATKEAISKLMTKTGLSSSEAQKLMKFAKDPSKYAKNLESMAQNRVKAVVNAQVNKLKSTPLGNTGLSLASLQNAKATYTSLLGVLGAKRRPSFDGLAKVTEGVKRAEATSVFKQKNSYNPATDSGAPYYGNNTKDLSGMLKTMASMKKDPQGTANQLSAQLSDAAKKEAKNQLNSYISSQMQPTPPQPADQGGSGG